MASLVELEEQQACLEHEIEEQLDALKNIAWSVFSSINKSADFSCEALESLENNARLKVMEVFAGTEFAVHDKVLMEETALLNHFETWTNQQAKNAEELKRMHAEMHYKEILNRLDQCRAEIKDCRAKKSRKQHELSTLKQNSLAGKAKMTTTLDNLGEALEALRAAISEEESQLTTIPVLINDEEDAPYLVWPAPALALSDLNEPAVTSEI